MIEHFFTCPHCWKTISILIDPTIPEQDYVEDCENCCSPIRFTIKTQNNLVTDFSAEGLGQ